MKNISIRNNSGDNWITPKDFYQKLDQIYHFDFDPCPINPKFDGLQIEWKNSNFVNPPYSRKLKEQFVKKAIYEKYLGNSSVLLLPVSTSTKLFHDFILPHADQIIFLKGRLKFNKPDSISKYCGQHDSMLIILKGVNNDFKKE